MDLTKIIFIKGTEGLFGLIKVLHDSILLEAIDDTKKRIIRNMGYSQIVQLNSVVIQITQHESLSLGEVFKKIDERKESLGNIDNKSTDQEVKEVFLQIFPNYSSNIPSSQILKISAWYKILKKYLPKLFEIPESFDVKALDSNKDASNSKELETNIGNTSIKDMETEKEISANKTDKSNVIDIKKEKKNVSNNNKEATAPVDEKVSPKNRIKNPVEKDNDRSKK